MTDSHPAQDGTENLMHGQAIAMQYVVYLLQKITADGGRDALASLLRNVRSVGGTEVTATTLLGCVWATNIVAALAVEFTLKALLRKECGRYKHTHDLLELYEALPDAVQALLENEFSRLSSGSLCALLAKHREDFVRWRYLDRDVEFLKSECTGLQLAICTILDVHNAR